MRTTAPARHAWPYRFVAVEGPIGVGKTTLARRLAERYGTDLLLEAPFENPFLARFYQNPRAWALSTQLSFLLQRARQLGELRQRDMFRAHRVADFVLQKDRLFAQLNLEPDELDLYEQVYARVIDSVPQPDLIIYLQASVPVLSARIRLRGIEFEQQIEEEYLHRMVEAYRTLFSSPSADIAPRVLVVNAEVADFANDAGHVSLLLDRLERLEGGQHYFDPLALI